jgi:hypothetical protein
MTAAAETSITGIEGESVLQSVGQAARDAAATAAAHAAKVRQSVGQAGYDPVQTLSRLVYTGSYVVAFGVVYAAVLVAQSLPQENPVMRGCRDGGRAAWDRLETGTDWSFDQAEPAK